MFPDFNNSIEGLARRKKINSQRLNEKGGKNYLPAPGQSNQYNTRDLPITDVNALKRERIALCNYKCK